MVTNKPKVGALVNTLDHPVYLSYMGESLVLSPKQKINNVNKEKVGALPKGVMFLLDSSK